MLPPAPMNFWDQVAKLLARLIFERETQLEKAVFERKLPHLAPITAGDSTPEPPPPQNAA